MKPWLKVALIAGIPLVIMTAIGIALLAEGKTSDGRSTIAVGVIVAAVAGAWKIYDIDSWSLRTQSLVHFGIMTVTVLPALLLSGWFPIDTPLGVLAVIGSFLLVGAVVWTVMYLVFTRLVPARKRRAERSSTGTESH